MSWPQDSMINPPIEELLGRVDSKFMLVTLASRRARQVNSYFGQLGEGGLGAIVPPQVTSTARKPLSIAFEEIAVDKITFERIDEAALAAAEAEEEEAARIAAEADAAAVLGPVDGDDAGA